jgi:hypothetical protein
MRNEVRVQLVIKFSFRLFINLEGVRLIAETPKAKPTQDPKTIMD